MNTATSRLGKSLVCWMLALVLAASANGPLLAWAAETGEVQEGNPAETLQAGAAQLSLGGESDEQPAVPSARAGESYISGGSDFASARSISTNTTYVDNLSSSSENDWFKVYLSQRGVLSLSFESSHYVTGSEYNRHFYNVYLYNDQNEELWKRDVIVGTTKANAAKTLATTGLPAGWYYIRVTDYHFTDKTYKINAKFTKSDVWETEFNDSMDTATAISLNKEYSGTLSSSSDYDWYKVSLSKAGVLSVSFESVHYETGSEYNRHYYNVYLYNDQAEELWKRDIIVGTTKANAAKTLVATGLPKGTYYIKVVDYNWTDKTYKINAKFSASNVWETEFNDSMNTADTLNSGVQYSATLMESNDADWYKLTLKKTGPLHIVFEPTHYLTGSEYNRHFYDVLLYDDQNNEIWDKDVIVGTTKNSGKSTFTSSSLAAGTYFIKVRDYHWTDKTYKIMARYDLVSIAKASITLNPASYTYDGNAKKPAATVKLGGKTLKAGTDYTVSYKNNVNAGTATAVITGAGAYTGTVNKTFKINSRTTWTRLEGTGSLDTMRKIVQAGWKNGAGGTVFVASWHKHYDALSAAGAAGLEGAPVLMTNKDVLSWQTAAELQRIKPKKIVIVGGTGAVSAAVASQIKAATGVAPVRYGGGNARGTAIKVNLAYKSKWTTGTAVLATQRTYHDALSAAPVAYARKVPVFLAADKDTVDASTISAMKACGVKRVVVLGKEGAISPKVVARLQASGMSVKRVGGGDARATSKLVAEWGLSQGMSANRMGVATAGGFRDALCGAALCGRNNAVLVLADDKGRAQGVAFAKANKAKITQGYVFGGTSAVGKATFDAFVAATK